jgi:hypothetical protein
MASPRPPGTSTTATTEVVQVATGERVVLAGQYAAHLGRQCVRGSRTQSRQETPSRKRGVRVAAPGGADQYESEDSGSHCESFGKGWGAPIPRARQQQEQDGGEP